ncbi:MAG: arginine--tRNA ligase, partial [bacterium]
MISGLLENSIVNACQAAVNTGELPSFSFPPVIIETPKDKSFGDHATNFAMQSAKGARMPPRKIAEILLNHFDKKSAFVEEAAIAGPGFINFRLSQDYWYQVLREILTEKDRYGSIKLNKEQMVQVEFVSANPTGPLHIGHGRGAAVGDTLANLLKKAGYRVVKEYYVNDAGRQMELLGKSLEIRYRQLLGEDIEFPEDGYQGDYLLDLAEVLKKEHGRQAKDRPLSFFTDFAKDRILEKIRTDLSSFGIKFDVWQSEKALCDGNEVTSAISWLQERGHTEEKEGALWFKCAELGDEKDRVLVRGNSQTTYLASDIAYHKYKYQEGYDRIIDVWGADHHGYVARIKAAVTALGKPADTLDVLLVQLVSLVRGGEKISMSTRGGKFVTLKEVIDEVGQDAARFFFLLRRYDSQYEFDLDLAKKQSNENPVYYVQYAHTRTCGIMREWEKQGHDSPDFNSVDLTFLDLPEEIDLIKKLAAFPDVIAESTGSLEPHRL